MSSNNSLSYKRAARILTVACGLLFSIFSIVYLFVLQKDVVGALHYSLSQGKTHYSPLVGAIIITVVLLVFRWGINGLMGLKGPVRTLSYFPSCLLLGVLTDVDRTIFHGGNIGDKWFWLLPLLLLIYIGVVYTLRRVFRSWLNQNRPSNGNTGSYYQKAPTDDGHIYATIRYLHAGNQSIRDARIHYP